MNERIELTDGFSVTETALVGPDEMTPEVMRRLGRAIAGLRARSQWAIGDWLLRGGAPPLPEAAAITGLLATTLMNYRTTCRAYLPGERVAGLSFWHHQCAQGLTDRGRRVQILREAKRKNWTADEMLERCALERPGGETLLGQKIVFRLNQFDTSNLHRWAAMEGVSSSEVAKRVVLDALEARFSTRRAG